LTASAERNDLQLSWIESRECSQRVGRNSTQLEWPSFQTGDQWQRAEPGIFPR